MTRYKNFAEMKEAINHYKSIAEEYSSRIYVMISRAREIRVKNITIIEEKDAEIENLKMIIQTLHDEKMTSNNEACNMILGLEESLNNAKIEIHTLNHKIEEYKEYYYKIMNTTDDLFVKLNN